MSDPRHDFESWLGDEMRRPVRVDPSMRARIMGRIRAEARARVVRPSPRLASPAARDARGNRRGSLAGQTGAVLAAGIAGILALGTLDGLAGACGTEKVGKDGFGQFQGVSMEASLI